MAPPTPAPIQPVKDPRNIRDKPVQQAMRTAIFNWLQESQIQATVSRQTLLSPTAKDFRAIFEHLVGLLDPTFVFGEKGKKFEDEVIPILKAHHYPFADALDKRWLAAPASMHSWPSLTAMLHWLSELSRVRHGLYSISACINPSCFMKRRGWHTYTAENRRCKIQIKSPRTLTTPIITQLWHSSITATRTASFCLDWTIFENRINFWKNDTVSSQTSNL